MRFLLVVFVLAVPLWSQQSTEPSLAPFRAAAKKAFTAEMDRAAKGDCPAANSSSEFNVCYEAALAQSNANLAAFRTAIRKSIEARKDLFGPQMLKHFESSEQTWDIYVAQQSSVIGDMVDSPEDKESSEDETHINLIRTHLRDLEKIYNILLNDNCGACLTDH